MNLNRRLFLRNSVSVAAVAAVSVAPAAAEAVGPDENPELVRLDAAFQDAWAVYTAADDRKRQARARYGELAPTLPEELVWKGPNGRALCEREVGVEGDGWPDGPGSYRLIYDSSALLQFHGDLFDNPKPVLKRLGATMRRLYETAKRYEDGIASAREASGLAAALQERTDAIYAIRKLVFDIADQEAKTFAGLLVKANALTCFAATGAMEAVTAKHVMGGKLAADILAVVGGKAVAS